MRPRLPVLREHQPALENCAYCPKLCRAKCPVSDAVPRDSLTPWGKMSMAWLVDRGDVAPSLSHADVVWGCTGCFACKTACEHDNPVVESLTAARHKIRQYDAAPPGVERVLQRHPQRLGIVARRSQVVAQELALSARSKDALVVGCGYWLYEPELASKLTAAIKSLVGELRLVSECCGAVHEAAGDTLGLSVQQQRMDKALAGVERLWVYDPGCAMSLRRYPMRTVVELVAQHLERLKPLGQSAQSGSALPEQPLRYHDPCQLGRGLGKYDEPRRLLARLTGTPAAEFKKQRVDALCSGGGALLPQSHPEAAARIGERRVAEHLELGGGTIVTACASGLRQFRRAGANVVDLGSLISEGISGQ